MGKLKNRVGEIRYNKYGSRMELIEYHGADNVIIKFEKGKPVKTTWDHFNKGKVKNVYDKSYLGIGYIGEGIYSSMNGKNKDIRYSYWSGMLERCYNQNYLTKRPTYKGCSVDEEWHNYQNFAKWYDDNYYEVGNERMHLDKDILHKGNKIYSPETCIFVPIRINALFVKSNELRGEYPIGVTFDKLMNKYTAQCNMGTGVNHNIGYYSNEKDAFYAYKKFKESYIKEIAKEYKNKIPNKLYDAMIKYEVLITD